MIGVDVKLYLTCTLVVFFHHFVSSLWLEFYAGSIAPPHKFTVFYDLLQHKGGFTVSHLSQIISKFHIFKKYQQTDNNFNHYIFFSLIGALTTAEKDDDWS